MERRSVLVFRLATIALVVTAFTPADATAKNDELKKDGSQYVQTIDKSFDVEKGGELHLSAPNGSVKVKTWDKDMVRVVAERKIKSRHESEAREVLDHNPTTVEKKGNDVWVETDRDHGWNDQDRIKASYRLTVPRNYNLDLKTAGGSIEVDDLDGNVRAKTAGGSIEIGKISGEVNVQTAGGSIGISGSGSHTVAKTAGGSIDIGKADGVVVAETAGGSISVESAAAGIDAKIDRTKGHYKIRSDFPIKPEYSRDKAQLNAKLSGGGDTIRLRTREGDIHIKKLKK
jgi:DUF4097 and DUF4098 domain-containing protein YvlB